MHIYYSTDNPIEQVRDLPSIALRCRFPDFCRWYAIFDISATPASIHDAIVSKNAAAVLEDAVNETACRRQHLRNCI